MRGSSFGRQAAVRVLSNRADSPFPFRRGGEWLACLMILSFLGAGPGEAAETAAFVDATDEYVHRRWGPEDGLADTEIRCLAQTSDGYLWLGTRAGLVRFDGRTFTTYTRANTGLLKDDHIVDVTTDASGALWVLTPHSVDQAPIVRVGNAFSPATLPPGTGVELGKLGVAAFAVRPGGGLLVSPNSRHWEAWTKGTVLRLDTNQFGFGSTVFESSDGVLWGIDGRHMLRAEDVRGPAARHPLPPAEGSMPRGAFAQDADGKVWLNWGADLPGSRRLLAVGSAGPVEVAAGLASNGARTEFLAASADGFLWMPWGGVGLQRHGKGTHARIGFLGRSHPDFVLCVLEDREGHLWCGSEYSGLHRLRLKRIRAVTVADGLPHGNVRTVLARSGEAWVGTDAGLGRIRDGGGGLRESAGVVPGWSMQPGSTNPAHVRVLRATADGEVWIGTSRGMFRHDGRRVDPVPLPILPTSADPDALKLLKVRDLAFDRNGGTWICGADCLAHLPDRTSRTNEIRYACGWAPQALFTDRSGVVWMATDGQGVVGIDPRRLSLAPHPEHPWLDGAIVARYSRTNHLSSDHAWSVFEDRAGRLWVATENGLNRLVPGRAPSTPAGRFVFTAEQGFPTDQINDLIEDDLGNFWFATDQGVFRVGEAELGAVAEGRAPRVRPVGYLEADGLPALETNGRISHPTLSKGPDGRVWVATVRGVAVVDPRLMVRSDPAALPVLEEVRVDDEVLFTLAPQGIAGGLQRVEATNETRRLDPGRARVIEFAFNGLHFAAPEACRFRYRLDGYDQPGQWHDAGARRTAFFTNLDPGRYRFEVLAANHQGIWSSGAATYAFELAPFYWQTWTFWGGVALAVGVAVSSGVQWRLRGVRRLEGLRREKAVLEERLWLARDLHDIVGAQFTELIHLGGALGKLPPDKAASAGVRIEALARDLFQSVRNTMWATTPEADHLEALVEHIAAAGRRLFDATGILLSLDIPLEIPEVRVGPVVRRHLFLAAQEALNNAAKHSGAREVWLRVRCDPGPESGGFVMEIEDDGRGIQEATAGERARRSGQGLGNMRRRVAEAGGTLDIRAREGGGTVVRIGMGRERTHEGTTPDAG